MVYLCLCLGSPYTLKEKKWSGDILFRNNPKEQEWEVGQEWDKWSMNFRVGYTVGNWGPSVC